MHIFDLPYLRSKTNAFYIFLVIISLHILVHIPFLQKPAIDTETSYYYAAQAIGNNHFNFFTPTREEKPPGVFIFPSVLLYFSPSIVWGRLQSLLASTVALLFVFLIGKALHSENVGVLSVLLCVFFPMFAVQSVFFTDSMPETAIFLALVYFYLTNTTWGYVLSACIAVLTKESLVLTPILFYGYSVISELYSRKKTIKKALFAQAYLLSPILIFLMWMLLNKLLFGFFFYPGNQINLIRGITSLHQNYRIVWIFLGKIATQSHIEVLLVFGGLLLLQYFLNPLKLHNGRTQKSIWIFLILMAFYSLFYGQFFHWSLRYILFLYPLVFILFVRLLYLNFSVPISQRIVYGCIVVFCVSQFQLLKYTSTSLYGEAIDLRVIPQRQYFQKIIREISEFPSNTPIYVDFQLAHYLWNPLFGYVKTQNAHVFQISEPAEKQDCPTCDCDTCVYADAIPKGKKSYFILYDSFSYSWQRDVMKYAKKIRSITPDWPKQATDSFSVYEYFRNE